MASSRIWQTPWPPLTWATENQQRLPGDSAPVTTAQHSALWQAKAQDHLCWPCLCVQKGLQPGRNTWSPTRSLGCYGELSPSSDKAGVSVLSPSWSHLPQSSHVSQWRWGDWIPSSFHPQQFCYLNQVHTWVGGTPQKYDIYLIPNEFVMIYVH